MKQLRSSCQTTARPFRDRVNKRVLLEAEALFRIYTVQLWTYVSACSIKYDMQHTAYTGISTCHKYM